MAHAWPWSIGSLASLYEIHCMAECMTCDKGEALSKEMRKKRGMALWTLEEEETALVPKRYWLRKLPYGWRIPFIR